MSKIHLRCLDFFKGLFMIAVITAHVSFWINDPNMMYIHGWAWMLFQFAGPAGFAVITSIGVNLSINEHQYIGDRGNREQFIRLIKRFCILYLFGIFFVADFSGTIEDFLNPIYLSRIHIFQLIALTQLFTFLATKMPKYARLIIIIIIILFDYFGYPYIIAQMEAETSITPVLFEGQFGSQALESVYGWLYMLLFRVDLHMGVIPWIIIPFLGSLGGDVLFNKVIKPVLAKEKHKEEQRQEISGKRLGGSMGLRDELISIEGRIRPLFAIAAVVYIIGILFGLEMISYFRGVQDLDWLNSGGGYYWVQYPTFLFNGSWQSMLYCTGVVFGFIGLGIKYNDLRRNSVFNVFETSSISKEGWFNRFWLRIVNLLQPLIDALEITGKYSMTAFLIHFIFKPFENMLSLPPRFSLPIMFGVAAFTIITLNIWHYKFDGRFTLEDIFLAQKKRENKD